jgi:amidase
MAASGLPAGLQIVGPRYEDDTPVTLAELLTDVTGGYQPPPGPGAAAPAGSPSSAFR